MRKANILFFIVFLLFFQIKFLHAQPWVWGKQANSQGSTFGIATDKAGDAFLAGVFPDTISFGSFHLRSLHNEVYVVKYDKYGNVKWALQSHCLNTFAAISVGNIVSDSAGNTCITGSFGDTVLIGTFLLISLNHTNTFVAKFDGNGNVLWVNTSMANANLSNSGGNDVGTDLAGNVYVTGSFNYQVSFGPYILSSPLASSLFLVKYAPNGNIIWARQSNSPTNDLCSVSASYTDMKGNNYITGLFTDTVSFPPFQIQSSAYGSCFVVKYDSAGNVKWVSQSKGQNISFAASGDITADGFGSVYVTGSFNDTISFGAVKLNSPRFVNAIFLAKFNSVGQPVWAKQSMSNSPNYVESFGCGLSADKFNNIYLSGGGNYDSLIFLNHSFYCTYDFTPAIILKLDTGGNILCSSIAPTGGIVANNITCDGTGRYIYLSGVTTDTITFGNDFLHYFSADQIPYVTRWRACQACDIKPVISGADTICEGRSVLLNAFGGTSYLWRPASSLNSDTSASPTANPDTITTYTVTISNDLCAIKDSVTVKVLPLPTISVCCDSQITYGENVQLISSGGSSYLWTPSAGLNCNSCSNPIATPLQNTTYTITVNYNGCISVKTITIDVSCGNMFVPTAFSPNEAHNNILYVRGPCIRDLYFTVYDRWGNKVFETENINNGWDGNHNGQPMNTGTYIYYAKATMYDGSTVEKKGNVALVR